MTEIINVNTNYSTTKRLIEKELKTITKELNEEKQPKNSPTTTLFLPEGEERQGEGGLRTKGYFKESSQDKPLITVITVVLNGEQFLEETILSVINQSYDNIEYVVIDGGSNDKTLDIVKKYEHAIDYWVSEKDEGIYDAMNKGIKLALGDGLNFLNAGDKFIGDVFDASYQIPYLFNCKFIDKNKKISTKRLKSNKLGMPTSHQAMVFKRSYITYSLDYEISSDYDYYLKHCSLESFHFVHSKGFVLYDLTGASSINYCQRDLETFDIIKNRFGLIPSYYFAIRQTLKFIIKSIIKWQ